MKKRILLLMVFALLMVGALFAEDYRYYMIRELPSSSVPVFMIIQDKEKLSDEQMKKIESYGGGSLNTKQDRIDAEAGVRNIKPYYEMGSLRSIFLDYTKNPDDPDMKYIDSFEELLKYIRWEK